MDVPNIRAEGTATGIEVELDLVDVTSPSPEQLHLQLARHDDITVDWFAALPLQRVPGTSTWRGTLPWPDMIRGGRLLQVTEVRIDQGSTVVPLGEPRLLLEPADGVGMWDSGDNAKDERQRLHNAREARFNLPLAAPGAGPNDQEWVVVGVVENVHLTHRQRVPGMEVIPLTSTTLGSDIPTVLNDVLAQVGFAFGVDITAWLTAFPRRAAVVHVPRIQATTVQDVLEWAQRELRALLDLVGLRRGDSPRLVAGVIGNRDGNGRLGVVQTWSNIRQYGGNLLGGFISGEDAGSLLTQWQGTLSHPRVQLWLSLYSDALADSRWDYRVFRLFNLLEGIGKGTFPKSTLVADPAGIPRLQDTGTPYTVREARGAVYHILQHCAGVRPHSEDDYATPAPGTVASLWDDTKVWTAIRNEVAHRGSWEHPQGVAPSAAWNAHEAAMLAVHPMDIAVARHQVVTALRRGAEDVIQLGIAGRV